ncbi:MAG: hypothetical protein AAB736_02835 [Patescibacteria group bacterium]
MELNYKFTKSLFPSNTLKEKVVYAVARKSRNTNELISHFFKAEGVTKQAVYKALRSLLREEIVIKQRKQVVINSAWLSQMKQLVATGERTIGADKEKTIFGPLSFKRKITLRFKNTESLDIYSGHLLLTLADHFKDKPFFFFNHHEWFIYDRPLSETYLYETVAEKGYKIFLTLGKNTSLARDFKRKFEKGNVQIAIDDSYKFPITDYLFVVEDFIIIARYDKKISEDINKLMTETDIMNENEIARLGKILVSCRDARIIIVRNKLRAQKIRRALAKNFVIKKSEL